MKSSGVIFSISDKRGLPIFPPSHTFLPAASRILAISVVVVVLPSLPVTAIIFDGQRDRNASISLVIILPLETADIISSLSNLMPGRLYTISSRMSAR